MILATLESRTSRDSFFKKDHSEFFPPSSGHPTQQSTHSFNILKEPRPDNEIGFNFIAKRLHQGTYPRKVD